MTIFATSYCQDLVYLNGSTSQWTLWDRGSNVTVELPKKVQPILEAELVLDQVRESTNNGFTSKIIDTTVLRQNFLYNVDLSSLRSLVAKTENGIKIIDKDGSEVADLSEKFDWAAPLVEGRSYGAIRGTKYNRRYQFLDQDGNVLFKDKDFAAVTHMRGGRAAILKEYDQRWQLLTKKGKVKDFGIGRQVTDAFMLPQGQLLLSARTKNQTQIDSFFEASDDNPYMLQRMNRRYRKVWYATDVMLWNNGKASIINSPLILSSIAYILQRGNYVWPLEDYDHDIVDLIGKTQWQNPTISQTEEDEKIKWTNKSGGTYEISSGQPYIVTSDGVVTFGQNQMAWTPFADMTARPLAVHLSAEAGYCMTFTPDAMLSAYTMDGMLVLGSSCGLIGVYDLKGKAIKVPGSRTITDVLKELDEADYKKGQGAAKTTVDSLSGQKRLVCNFPTKDRPSGHTIVTSYSKDISMTKKL